jgi:hypothetical protein
MSLAPPARRVLGVPATDASDTPQRRPCPTAITTVRGLPILASIDCELRVGTRALLNRRYRVLAARWSFAGFRFPPGMMMFAVRWYVRYGLPY